jgi:hypothetical protein
MAKRKWDERKVRRDENGRFIAQADSYGMNNLFDPRQPTQSFPQPLFDPRGPNPVMKPVRRRPSANATRGAG